GNQQRLELQPMLGEQPEILGKVGGRKRERDVWVGERNLLPQGRRREQHAKGEGQTDGLSSHCGTPERSSADLGCCVGKNQAARHALRHLGLSCVANSRSLGSNVLQHRHGRACSRPCTSCLPLAPKTWMLATSAGMTRRELRKPIKVQAFPR